MAKYNYCGIIMLKVGKYVTSNTVKQFLVVLISNVKF